TDEERVAALIVAADKLSLHDRKRRIPREFMTGLFARVVPEDLSRYRASEIAALAEAVWSFMAERKPGEPKVAFDSPPATADGTVLSTISVLTVVNDDMPFLLDSVMGELAERGLDIRLVAHPVFTVERDAAGTLASFRGAKAATGAARRESFIHIHVERIDEARRTETVAALAQ